MQSYFQWAAIIAILTASPIWLFATMYWADIKRSHGGLRWMIMTALVTAVGFCRETARSL